MTSCLYGDDYTSGGTESKAMRKTMREVVVTWVIGHAGTGLQEDAALKALREAIKGQCSWMGR